MGQVLRRQFLVAASALLASPLARAQQSNRIYVVGTLFPVGYKDTWRPVLREQLAIHGFVEGRNLRIELGRLEGAGIGSGQQATRELIAKKVDAILSSSDAITEGALMATKSVPIVFVGVSDPLLQGIVASLARPGGNVTGVASRAAELSQKRFELALELVPGAKRVALVGIDLWAHYGKAVRPILVKAAKSANVELLELNYSVHLTIEEAHKAGAQVVVTHSNMIGEGQPGTLEAWAKTSIQRRLPVIYAGSEEVEAGGLISYGINIIEALRRGADLMARVLKGENPGDLPVDQASRFDLAVNLKTAKALGLTIPPSILLRADTVIE